MQSSVSKLSFQSVDELRSLRYTIKAEKPRENIRFPFVPQNVVFSLEGILTMALGTHRGPLKHLLLSLSLYIYSTPGQFSNNSWTHESRLRGYKWLCIIGTEIFYPLSLNISFHRGINVVTSSTWSRILEIFLFPRLVKSFFEGRFLLNRPADPGLQALNRCVSIGRNWWMEFQVDPSSGSPVIPGKLEFFIATWNAFNS